MAIDVEAVLRDLDLEQKVSLLAGFDAWHTMELPGVPAMRCSDGPAGVRGTSWQGPRSASFPCGSSLGASFDPALVEEIGHALGREARSKGVNVLLAPTVNLHRTPIGGRNFECISEDPWLTARIAVGYVRGVQAEGVAACIKHFVANDTEFERMSISSEVDERTLRELYLAPFEAAVAPLDRGGAGVQALMSSYNKVNGTFASEHSELLRGVLREDWCFDGVVISDWYGTHSAAASLEAGLDLEMPGPARLRGANLLAALRDAEVTESRVDESVRRLLDLFVATGVGERGTEELVDDSVQTRDVIRRAAIAGMVLLKNDVGLLPLALDSSIALIGPNAERGQIQGGGSAKVRPNRPIGVLSAIRGRGLDVTYEQGCSIDKRLAALTGEFVVHYESGDGATADVPTDRLSLMWMDAPAAKIDKAHFGARISGSFVPAVTGDWQFGVTSVGAAVLRINGEVVVDLSSPQTGGAFFGMGSPEIRGTVALEQGVPAIVDVDYAVIEYPMLRGLLIGAAPPAGDDPVGDAVRAAAAASVAVLVVGTNDDWETEGEDRDTLSLPGRQDELIARVAQVNPNTVVVINAGSPVAMPWLDSVAAVMQVWFPGEEFGEALADVLLGIAEPGGRLPLTIPRRLEDTPAYAHHPGRNGLAVYGEGLNIGYRWYDAEEIEPLFVFGHGLGYTTFEFGPSAVAGTILTGVDVTVSITNSGSRVGSEVVQCYVEPPAGGPVRPLRTLGAFVKVVVSAGASATVTLHLDERAFSVWDVAAHGWVVPTGEYRVVVGNSSRELREAGSVTR
ncbi:MAG: glycoside hydrolase family 3 C-terminal domain-containing protein [Ilumatobacteraceae bacterium]